MFGSGLSTEKIVGELNSNPEAHGERRNRYDKPEAFRDPLGMDVR